ncbi:MAG: serine protease [Polyangiaceae bacterium]
MATLGRVHRVVPAVEYFEEGLRVSRGVVSVRTSRSGSMQATATGWLIAPRLVLTAAHVVDLPAESETPAEGETPAEAQTPAPEGPSGAPSRGEARQWEIASHLRAGEPAWVLPGRLVWQSGPADLALVELPEPPPATVLQISVDKPALGTDLLILQHGRDNPLGVSQGVLVNLDSAILAYDADTGPGSSGAPVLSRFEVVGMHLGWRAVDASSPADGGQDKVQNYGVPSSRIIEELRRSPVWSEIAAHQKLATLASGPASLPFPPVVTGVPLWAAVRWSFDPAALPDSQRRRLARDVVDSSPGATTWSLRPDARMRALAAAGSREALVEARGPEPIPGEDQRRIDHLLRGEPLDLASMSDTEISEWIPLVRWFSPVLPGLPDGSALMQVLAERRLRGRLNRIRGAHFVGRVRELSKIDAWFEAGSGPMVISGIGGAGKSAFLAAFLLAHAPLFVWLDFDDARIAPDDAPTLFAEVARQLELQLPGVTAGLHPAAEWADGLRSVGAALASRQPPVDRLVLVLDSFETAQYGDRHSELWPFVEALSAVVPGLKVIVSGRAPLSDLVLSGEPATPLHLGPLSPEEASEWMDVHGAFPPALVRTVVDLTRGIAQPRLALQLVKGGSSLTGSTSPCPSTSCKAISTPHPRELTGEKVTELARRALVLRRVTEAMLFPVLAARLSASKASLRPDRRPRPRALAR